MNDEWNFAPTLVGIMGEGYGGFVSLLGLSTLPRKFHCGIGIRPIVNWNLYCKLLFCRQFRLCRLN